VIYCLHLLPHPRLVPDPPHLFTDQHRSVTSWPPHRFSPVESQAGSWISVLSLSKGTLPDNT
jgi:hypothetical protein